LGTRMGLASQSGWYTSLMKPVSSNLAISFFITSFCLGRNGGVVA
jgi:hypothetical protein